MCKTKINKKEKSSIAQHKIDVEIAFIEHRKKQWLSDGGWRYYLRPDDFKYNY